MAEMRRADEPVPIACDLGALTPDERRRRAELAGELRAQTQRIRALKDGFALCLRPDPEVCRTALEFALLERRCCAFLDFTLDLEAEGGSVRLSLRGREGVKAFLAQTSFCGGAKVCG